MQVTRTPDPNRSTFGRTTLWPGPRSVTATPRGT